jgi:hypothetical protein
MAPRRARRGAFVQIALKQDREGGLCPECSQAMGGDWFVYSYFKCRTADIPLGTPIVNKLEDLYSLLFVALSQYAHS